MSCRLVGRTKPILVKSSIAFGVVMTSRRKAKRVNWIYSPSNMFVRNDDGTNIPLAWEMKWYEKGWTIELETGKYNCRFSNPDHMWGCVKKSIQQKHRGSWNLIGIDPWYSKGYITWKRD